MELMLVAVGLYLFPKATITGFVLIVAALRLAALIENRREVDL